MEGKKNPNQIDPKVAQRIEMQLESGSRIMDANDFLEQQSRREESSIDRPLTGWEQIVADTNRRYPPQRKLIPNQEAGLLENNNAKNNNT